MTLNPLLPAMLLFSLLGGCVSVKMVGPDTPEKDYVTLEIRRAAIFATAEQQLHAVVTAVDGIAITEKQAYQSVIVAPGKRKLDIRLVSGNARIRYTLEQSTGCRLTLDLTPGTSYFVDWEMTESHSLSGGRFTFQGNAVITKGITDEQHRCQLRPDFPGPSERELRS